MFDGKAIVNMGPIELSYHTQAIKKHSEFSLITSLTKAMLKTVKEEGG
jgi:hypothetical protein